MSEYEKIKQDYKLYDHTGEIKFNTPGDAKYLISLIEQMKKRFNIIIFKCNRDINSLNINEICKLVDKIWENSKLALKLLEE